MGLVLVAGAFANAAAILVSSNTVVNSHDDLMPIDIDMSLHEGHGLVKHIITSSNKINIQNLMITDYTEHSFVVICCFLRVELNDNSHL